jgi:Na+(H+)/acetate symporter ActP
VDPSFQGSVFAAELALYTVTSSASSLGAGAAFQQHLLSTQGLAAAMAAIAGTLLVSPAPFWRLPGRLDSSQQLALLTC